jgi:membrane protein DedA with SNARE-associated domain
MVTSGLGVGAFVAIVLGACVLGYAVGRITGKQAERRRWERRMAGEARSLDRTRAIIRRALEKDGGNNPGPGS